MFQSLEEKAEKLKEFLELYSSILNGETTCVPDVVTFPYGNELCRAFLSFVEQANKSIPQWSDMKEWFVEAEITAYDANVLDNMVDACGNSGLSSLTLKAFRGDDGHVESVVAFIAALHGVSISRRIRNTFLFRRLIESLKNTVMGLNDVIGIRKDVRQNEVNTLVLSPVRYNGVKIQNAWNNAIEWLNREKMDFLRLCTALRKAYPNNQNLHKVVRICEIIEDGHFQWMFDLKGVRYEN